MSLSCAFDKQVNVFVAFFLSLAELWITEVKVLRCLSFVKFACC